MSAAADAVVHTAFFHTGDYEEATRLDIAAVGAMTDAMAGSNKPFIMSSATGVLGETGPVPVSEEFPLDPHHCIKPPGSRVLCERVRKDSNSILICHEIYLDAVEPCWQCAWLSA